MVLLAALLIPRMLKLRELFLNGNCIGDKGVVALAQALPRLTRLELLSLSCTLSLLPSHPVYSDA